MKVRAMQISGERASWGRETRARVPGDSMSDALARPMRWPLWLEWSRQGENGRTRNQRANKGGGQRAEGRGQKAEGRCIRWSVSHLTVSRV